MNATDQKRIEAIEANLIGPHSLMTRDSEVQWLISKLRASDKAAIALDKRLRYYIPSEASAQLKADRDALKLFKEIMK